MFGANAPKLTRTIIEELKTEQSVMAGEKTRDTFWEVTELSPDEQVFEPKQPFTRNYYSF